MEAVRGPSVDGDVEDQGVERGMALARASLVLLGAAAVGTVATIAAGSGFAASTAGGLLLVLPALVALALAGLALVAGRAVAGVGRVRPIGSAVALSGSGLLLFGVSWVVLAHNL
jgi:hypothetical protein